MSKALNVIAAVTELAQDCGEAQALAAKRGEEVAGLTSALKTTRELNEELRKKNADLYAHVAQARKELREIGEERAKSFYIPFRASLTESPFDRFRRFRVVFDQGVEFTFPPELVHMELRNEDAKAAFIEVTANKMAREIATKLAEQLLKSCGDAVKNRYDPRDYF